jgi:hypothetical protein
MWDCKLRGRRGRKKHGEKLKDKIKFGKGQ